MKKNLFKLKNIIKLSKGVRRTKKAVQSLKINANSLEIEAKEEYCTTVDDEGIIFHLQAFHMYMQILIFLASSDCKQQFQ